MDNFTPLHKGTKTSFKCNHCNLLYTVKNITKMTKHILNKCSKCPGEIKSGLKKGLNKSDSAKIATVVHISPVTSTPTATTSDVSNTICTTTTTVATSPTSSKSSWSRSRDISTFFDHMSASEKVSYFTKMTIVWLQLCFVQHSISSYLKSTLGQVVKGFFILIMPLKINIIKILFTLWYGMRLKCIGICGKYF